MTNSTIRFFDMFSGIGGFRAGLEKAGGFTCIGHSEIDKHADRAYRKIHHIKGEEIYYEDARNIDTKTMPDFDLITAGFPCQSFSIAGKRKGFEDERGTLFFEIAKVVREKQPPYLLLENVPGLLSHHEGKTFETILTTLSELGYHVEWAVLNSKDFGVPQSRKRVYLIGYLDARCAGNILPIRETNPKTLKVLLNGGHQSARVYDASFLSPTLTSSHGSTGLYAVNPSKEKDTPTPYRIRKLTPRECLRLQGFEEKQIDNLLSVTSDAGAYKQAGNAVTVNVVHAIGLNLKAVHKKLMERREQ